MTRHKVLLFEKSINLYLFHFRDKGSTYYIYQNMKKTQINTKYVPSTWAFIIAADSRRKLVTHQAQLSIRCAERQKRRRTVLPFFSHFFQYMYSTSSSSMCVKTISSLIHPLSIDHRVIIETVKLSKHSGLKSRKK